MAWFRIRELLWNSLDTGWKLRIVAVRKDSQLQEGLIFGTSEILFLMANRKAYEVDRLNTIRKGRRFPGKGWTAKMNSTGV